MVCLKQRHEKIRSKKNRSWKTAGIYKKVIEIFVLLSDKPLGLLKS